MRRNEGIHRRDISGEAWERIKELLSGQAGKRGAGSPPPLLSLIRCLCARRFGSAERGA